MSYDRLHTLLQYLLPHHFLSRTIGLLTNNRTPWLKNWMIKKFIQVYGVDMQTALQPDPLQYADFNSFFTRVLKPGVRPIKSDANTIICPVDGCISQFGHIDNGQLIQAKGIKYSLHQLLGGSDERAQPFQQGQFMTIYLAPKDYHRVHMPIAGQLKETVYVPGRLFSVNPCTTEAVPGLFARNERLVAIFETTLGKVAVIMVGAMLVASINTVWSGMITPSARRVIDVKDYSAVSLHLNRAAEMGYFQLGSTVILLFEPGRMQWSECLANNQAVQLGQPLGKIQ